MLREDVGLVYRIVKEHIDELRAELEEKMSEVPVAKQSKPVDVDIDGIVKLVLEKIATTSVSISSASTEIPKKGKEK